MPWILHGKPSCFLSQTKHMGKVIHADSKNLMTAKDFKSLAKTEVTLGRIFPYLLHYVCYCDPNHNVRPTLCIMTSPNPYTYLGWAIRSLTCLPTTKAQWPIVDPCFRCTSSYNHNASLSALWSSVPSTPIPFRFSIYAFERNIFNLLLIAVLPESRSAIDGQSMYTYILTYWVYKS